MDRTKIDLLLAYAMRSPFESDDRGVGDPRLVVGEAAQMASIVDRQRKQSIDILSIGLTGLERHCIRGCGVARIEMSL